MQASQDSATARASDRLVVLPVQPFRYQVRKRPPTNTDPVRKYLNNPDPRSMDQSMREEHSIVDEMELYISHTNPWRL